MLAARRRRGQKKLPTARLNFDGLFGVQLETDPWGANLNSCSTLYCVGVGVREMLMADPSGLPEPSRKRDRETLDGLSDHGQIRPSTLSWRFTAALPTPAIAPSGSNTKVFAHFGSVCSDMGSDTATPFITFQPGPLRLFGEAIKLSVWNQTKYAATPAAPAAAAAIDTSTVPKVSPLSPHTQLPLVKKIVSYKLRVKQMSYFHQASRGKCMR